MGADTMTLINESEIDEGAPQGYVAIPKKVVYAGALLGSALLGAAVTHFAEERGVASVGDADATKLLPCSNGVKCQEARFWAAHGGKFNNSGIAYRMTAKLSTWTTTAEWYR